MNTNPCDRRMVLVRLITSATMIMALETMTMTRSVLLITSNGNSTKVDVIPSTQSKEEPLWHSGMRKPAHLRGP